MVFHLVHGGGGQRTVLWPNPAHWVNIQFLFVEKDGPKGPKKVLKRLTDNTPDLWLFDVFMFELTIYEFESSLLPTWTYLSEIEKSQELTIYLYFYLHRKHKYVLWSESGRYFDTDNLEEECLQLHYIYIYIFINISTAKPDPKIVAVVDRWSLFRSNSCNMNSKWTPKWCGSWR